MSIRRSPQLMSVLAEFLHGEGEWRYGYDISRDTGLKSGTLYPILMRLAEHGMLETSWEAQVEGRPPRHLYKITSDGLRYAQEQLSEAASKMAARQPAFGGVAVS